MRRVAAALLLSIAACTGSDRAGVPGDTAIAVPQEASRVEDTARARADTAGATTSVADSDGPTGSSRAVVVLAADSAAGDSLFQRGGRCFTCHGSRAEGIPNLGPALADSVWLHGDGSPAMIERAIADGVLDPKESRIAMPAFAGQLSRAQIAKLAAYIYAISHPGSAVADTANTASVDSTPPDSASGVPHRSDTISLH